MPGYFTRLFRTKQAKGYEWQVDGNHWSLKIPHHDYLPMHRFSVIYDSEERATLKIEREVKGGYQSELEANFINGQFAFGERFILLGLENQSESTQTLQLL